MKLSDLQPTWRRIYRDRDQTPDNGGFPTENHELTFICPDCGPPFVVGIKVGPKADAGNHVWQCDPQPDGPDWPSRVTIVPSINNTGAGHGPRHPTCSFHKTIIGGELG